MLSPFAGLRQLEARKGHCITEEASQSLHFGYIYQVSNAISGEEVPTCSSGRSTVTIWMVLGYGDLKLYRWT